MILEISKCIENVGQGSVTYSMEHIILDNPGLTWVNISMEKLLDMFYIKSRFQWCMSQRDGEL